MLSVGDSVRSTVALDTESSNPLPVGTKGKVKRVLRTANGLLSCYPYTVDFDVPFGNSIPVDANEIEKVR